MKKYRCPHCGEKCISTLNKITPGFYGPPIRGFVKSGSECPNCGGMFTTVIKSKNKFSNFLFYAITFVPFLLSFILVLFPDLRFFSLLGITIYFFLFILFILPLYNYFFTDIAALDVEGNVKQSIKDD